LCFGLLVARASVAVGRLLKATELMYLVDQASRMGACVALVLCVLACLDERTRERRAALVGFGVVALAAPKAWSAARYLAQTDALTRRGVPVWLSMGACLAVLMGLVLFGWRYQRAREPARLHPWALAVFAGLLGVDATIGFSQAGLVPFCYGAAALISVVLTGALFPRRSWALSALAGWLNAVLLSLGLFGLSVPAYAERGRADLHRAVSSLTHLDMHLSDRSAAPSLLESLRRTEALDCRVGRAAERPLGLAPSQRKNVIVISIDSTRADDASSLHHGRPLMPELSRFMRESWTGRRAYSAYPATLMSLSAAFTGLLPSRLMMQSPAPPSLVGASLASSHERVAVLPTGSYFQREPIEHYLLQGSERLDGQDASAQTRLAIAKLRVLRQAQRAHVMWVHYLEPHEPYRRHPGFDLGTTPRERYRSELAYVDAELGKLLAELRRGGWYEDSVIFVFSDHGEAFGEHGQDFHHFQLYPWLIRVPFAMHVPGQPARTLQGPVHLSDVAATALEFVGASPALALDGSSLLSQEPRADRAIVSEEFPTPLRTLARYARGAPLGRAEAQRRARELEISHGYPSKVSLIQGEHQLILHRATGVVELYDLARDPGAQHNLAFDEAARTLALERALQDWFSQIARSTGCLTREPRAAVR